MTEKQCYDGGTCGNSMLIEDLEKDCAASQNHNTGVIDPITNRLISAGIKPAGLSWMVQECILWMQRAEEQVRWISVEERLPEENCRIPIVFNVLGTQLLGVAFYYVVQKSFRVIGDNGEEIYSVTHWMPLPLPPSSEVANG